MVDNGGITYPSQYGTEFLLRDGSRIKLRPIKQTDTESWLAFVSRLGRYTKHLRFHHVPKVISRENAIRFCTVDYTNSFALVAEVLSERRREIVAVGRYYRLPNKHSAEIALVVDDAYQGKGIGTGLIKLLINAAQDHEITTFEADILAENQEMMAVLTNYGFHITRELEAGVYHVTFPIAGTMKMTRKEEERECISTLSSLRFILNPRSVAVIGASREPNTIGQLLMQCLLQSQFSGIIYPVNPNAEAVMSVKAFPSVLDIPDNVDLAVVAVPAPIVINVADECGQKRVPAIIVISDGFGERGPEGLAREKELREITLGYGMRLVGPNCMGVINTDPAVKLNATFSSVYPPQGNVAFLSQSGALGLAILDYANSLNMGISSFVSVGNRADVSSNDLLLYWEQDPATKVILLYLESFGNPRKFGRIARRVSAVKPIAAMKGGSTKAGSRAASSHTGALATPEIASDALFLQAGILRVNTMEELFDVATLMSNQPVPKGKRVVIVTNGGGPGILAADACERHGLILPEFSPNTEEQLRNVIRQDIGLRNPLDLTAGATEEEFENVLQVLAGDKDNDAGIVIFIPPVTVPFDAIERAIRRVAPAFRRQAKPLLVCFVGQRGFRSKLGTIGRFVPCYPFPEDAVSALVKASEYREWLEKPKGNIPRISGLKRNKAENIIEKAISGYTQRPIWLSASQIADLLNCYGIRFAEVLRATTASEAAASAFKLGFPVAIKLASSSIVHKTEVGGVLLDLKSEKEVKEAFHNIKEGLRKIGREHEMEGVNIQRMVKEGIETIVGVTQDVSFGPLIMFGLGGIYAELLEDVAVRLHPLTNVDAKELITSTKMSRLFNGFRGSPPADAKALEDLLLRLSAMIEDLPQITELDFNPVKVMPRGEGYWVVDARIMLR